MFFSHDHSNIIELDELQSIRCEAVTHKRFLSEEDITQHMLVINNQYRFGQGMLRLFTSQNGVSRKQFFFIQPSNIEEVYTWIERGLSFREDGLISEKVSVDIIAEEIDLFKNNKWKKRGVKSNITKHKLDLSNQEKRPYGLGPLLIELSSKFGNIVTGFMNNQEVKKSPEHNYTDPSDDQDKKEMHSSVKDSIALDEDNKVQQSLDEDMERELKMFEKTSGIDESHDDHQTTQKANTESSCPQSMTDQEKRYQAKQLIHQKHDDERHVSNITLDDDAELLKIYDQTKNARISCFHDSKYEI